LEDAGFEPNTIPAIGLFDVLEHIRDDADYLAAIRRLLRPQGRIYLTVPAHDGLWSVEDEASGHYRRYDLAQLRSKLTSAGYEVEYATYFFSFFPALVFLLRTLPSAIGLRGRSKLARNRREISVKSGVMNRLLEWHLARELNRIGRRQVRFGSSCLVAARSTN
jgi:SAM-dependent methyltransferase